MNTNTKKIFALLVALIISLSSLSPSFAACTYNSYYDYKEHRELESSDLIYSGFDPATMNSALKMIEKNNKAGGDEKELRQAYDELLREYDRLRTQSALISIQYYADVHDEEAAAEERRLSELAVELGDKSMLAIKSILQGPMSHVIADEVSEANREYIEEYEEMSDEMKELIKRETQLTQDYHAEISKAQEAGGSYDEIVQAEHDATAPIFLELVQIRDRMAKIDGYDNYSDYAYEMYYRDFDPEDIAELRQAVKDEFAPLVNEFYYKWSSLQEPRIAPAGGEKILDQLEPGIKGVSPELSKSWDYMRKYHTYDIEDSDSKAEVGFTMSLPDYGCAYIFMKPYGGVYDYTTMVHEFGHYNADFHNTEIPMYQWFTIDVMEIQSQGLQLLMVPHYSKIFGAKATEYIETYELTNLAYSVTAGFQFDEFQDTIYRNPDMTIEEIDELAGRLDDEYNSGYNYYAEQSWVEISHNFESPMYYISYATSALAALEIYEQSHENRDEAIDCYMRISALPTEVQFQEALEIAGISNMIDEDNIRALAEAYHERYFLYEGEEKPNEDVEQPGTEDKVPSEDKAQSEEPEAKDPFKIVTKIVAAVFLVLGVIFVIVGSRKKDNSHVSDKAEIPDSEDTAVSTDIQESTTSLDNQDE